jgi:site-specific recombinase XerC
MTPIAPHITAYLQQRLPQERQASRHTVDTYCYAFKLLFEFASQRLGVAPSDLMVEQLDAPLLLDFLEHLQTHRGNSGRTRNARLVAIKSFMHFLEYRVPSALDQIRRVLAIPVQRTDVPLVRHVNADEYQAILDAPDPTTRLGIRDRAIFYMGFAGGLRVSEIVGLRIDDLTFDGRYVDVHVRGKGRKHRRLSLWEEVAQALRAWIAVRGDAPAPELFLNWRGEPMTRWGCGHVLKKHTAAAASACPSVATRRVSPHVLRHTCAMSVLQATGDIRKVALWLGHASQRTSEIYLPADPTEKLAALDAVKLPSIRPGKFEPPDRLIAMLSGKDPAAAAQAAPAGKKSSATSRSPAPDR